MIAFGKFWRIKEVCPPKPKLQSATHMFEGSFECLMRVIIFWAITGKCFIISLLIHDNFNYE